MTRKLPVLCGLLCILGIEANAAKVILEQTFEDSDGGWMTYGQGGDLRVTHNAGYVKAGKGALEFEYQIAPKQIAVAIFPLFDVSLGAMKALRFWLKTDSATPVAVLLSERKPGGDYTAVVWSPKDTWQQIELRTEQFALNEGANDPKDPNGKLDLDEIQAIGILDLSQYLNMLPENPKLPLVIERHSGTHRFFVDDFQVLSEAAAAGTPADYLDWFTLGGAQLSLDRSGKSIAGRALEAEYDQAEGRFVLLMHFLAGIDLSKAGRLRLDIASDKKATMVVSLEKKNPGGPAPRYNATIEVPGGRQLTHKEIPFADFKLDENGPKDSDQRLDTTKLKTVSLLDITGAVTHETVKNTIWIGSVRGLP